MIDRLPFLGASRARPGRGFDGGISAVRKFLVVVLTALMLVSLTGTPPASAWEPAEQATFNVPRPWGTTAQHLAIIRKVEKSINRTPAGETILIATYLFDRRSSVNALIDACRRGVSVRVILDGQIASGQSRRLVSALNGDNVRPEAATAIGPGRRPGGAAALPRGLRTQPLHGAPDHDERPRPRPRSDHLGQGPELRQEVRRKLSRHRARTCTPSSTPSRAPERHPTS